jgi:hypothetical protein
MAALAFLGASYAIWRSERIKVVEPEKKLTPAVDIIFDDIGEPIEYVH